MEPFHFDSVRDFWPTTTLLPPSDDFGNCVDHQLISEPEIPNKKYSQYMGDRPTTISCFVAVVSEISLL